MLWVILTVFTLALIYYRLRQTFKYWPQRGVKQGQPVIVLGDSWKVITGQQSIAEMMEYIYGMCSNVRYSGFYQFCTPGLLIRDPALIKQMLVKDFDHFADHLPLFPEDGDALWRRNLFSLTGREWRDMRATLSPSFTSSKMKFLFGLIQSTADDFVDHFKINDKKEEDKEIEVELKDIFTRFTNDVIASSAFGLKVNSLKDRENLFFVMGRDAVALTGVKFLKFFGYALFPKLFKMLNISFFDQHVNDFFLNVVQDTIKARQDQKILRPDMIHLLMEARKGQQKCEIDENLVIDNSFAATANDQDCEDYKDYKDLKIGQEVSSGITDLDIAAQAMIFFFAGFESVSGLLSFMGYELAVNLEVQNRLREEILDTWKTCKGKLTYEALLKMKYLDMVVSEVLRKWPSAVSTERICTNAYTIKADGKDEVDVHLPAKTNVWVPIFALHRDPQYYPDPEKFDPERFSDENKARINPYAYIPFGVGPRSCIGSRFALMETKVVMFHLLKDFEVVPSRRSIIPLKIHRRSLMLSAKNGFWFKFRRVSK